MESPYCRKKTTREYLQPDLTVKKMSDMFVNENKVHVSYQLYLSVFRSMKLSFYHPKNEQCELFYIQTREILNTYQYNFAKKECVRRKKQQEWSGCIKSVCSFQPPLTVYPFLMKVSYFIDAGCQSIISLFIISNLKSVTVLHDMRIWVNLRNFHLLVLNFLDTKGVVDVFRWLYNAK